MQEVWFYCVKSRGECPCCLAYGKLTETNQMSKVEGLMQQHYVAVTFVFLLYAIPTKAPFYAPFGQLCVSGALQVPKGLLQHYICIILQK